MRYYRASAVILLARDSVVVLDERQAADRAGRIESLGDGRYRLLDALQIKAGEAFGYEGELPKAIAEDVEAAGKKTEATPAEPKRSEDAPPRPGLESNEVAAQEQKPKKKALHKGRKK